MAAAAILKISKIAISRQQFDRSLRNLARLCKIGLLTVLAIKKLNFQNPRWPSAANLKTVKWPYLRNRLTDFWWNLAWWRRLDLYGGQTVKISNFSKKQDGGGHLQKPHNSPYHNNGLTDLREIWHDYAKCLLSARPLKNLNFQNPRWRTAAIVKTVKSPYLCNRLTDFDEI